MSYMTKQELTKKQAELMMQAERQEPVTIYQLAKDVGRPYRRVYDNIQKFVEKGLVELESVKINNRDAMKVISFNPYYQRLIRLDDMYATALDLSASENGTHSSISFVVRKLSSILNSHGAILGGVCANLHGIEQYEKVVEFTVDLSAKKTMKLLSQEGIYATLNSNDAGTDSTWMINGDCDWISYQIVPADSVGVNINDAIEEVGIRIASEKDFITSKCMVGGQQDLHDVAVMALLNKRLKWFAMQQAEAYDCRDKLDIWLADEQLLSHYGAPG
ncbi:MAG: helix-turn-helix domain-containing protein [Mariprofundaceae bacterium]